LDPNCDENLLWENWILILMCSTHNLISCLDSQSENQFNFNRRFKFNYLLQIISMILENHFNFNLGFKVRLPCSHNWWLIPSLVWFCAPIYVSNQGWSFEHLAMVLSLMSWLFCWALDSCWWIQGGKIHLSSHGNSTFVGTTHSSANFTPSLLQTYEHS
jgi:hypothetical protein